MAIVFTELSLLALKAAEELIRKGPMPSIPRPGIKHSHKTLDRLIAQLESVPQDHNGEMVLEILRRARSTQPQWRSAELGNVNHSELSPHVVEGVATCLRLVQRFSLHESCLQAQGQPTGERLGYLFSNI